MNSRIAYIVLANACLGLLCIEAGLICALLLNQARLANTALTGQRKWFWLHRLSVVLTLFIFVLISLGGLVRNAGAGLACPDWPLCFGKVVPPMDAQVFLEWFHRLIAGSVSVFLLGISAFVFYVKEFRKKFAKFCIAALLLLVAQVVLGGLTVLGLLDPKWVSSHLAIGIAFFLVILWMTLRISNLGPFEKVSASQSSNKAKKLARSALIALVLVYFQALLGGLVSSNYAGLACPDFPTCYGNWLPSLQGPENRLIRLQFFHRLGALVAFCSVALFLVQAFEKKFFKQASMQLKIALSATALLVLVQVCLGIGSVLFQLPLPMSVAHLGTAAALLAILVITRMIIFGNK